MTTPEVFQHACEKWEQTSCTGFSGGHDTYICYKPCRLTYRMATRDYVRSEDWS